MKYFKTIRFRNIKMRLITNSSFIANLVSSHLASGKDAINYRKNINVSLDLKEVDGFPYDRGDYFSTHKNNLSLNCWLKNIHVNVYPNRNLIVGKILMPTALSNEAILDLLIIHPLRHILKYKNIFMIHAACLAKNNKGVLVCGGSKAGKSTLAMKLVENGFKFLGDEFVIFDKGQLLSFPLKIGLDRNSIRVFAQLEKLAKNIEKNYEKSSFDVQDLYPGCRVKSCIPKLIVFPVPQKKSKIVSVESINKETTFSFLCMDKDNSLPFEKNLNIRQKQIQVLAALAEKTKSYCLSYSLPKLGKAAKTIDKLLSY